jgi:putative ABC transport system substrate-binding protein
MNRRRFVAGAGAAGLGLLAGCGRLPWQGQSSRKVPRVGTLSGAGLNAATERNVESFRQGLRERGYLPGETILLEHRFADGRAELLPSMAAELVRLPVDILVAAGDTITLAAMEATSTVPIVMCAARDPIGNGIVDSLARPGGNVTGTSAMTDDLTGKRLELLKETVPNISRLAIMGTKTSARQLQDAEVAARMLSVQIQHLEVSSPADFGPALETAIHQRVEALLLLVSPLIMTHAVTIAELAATHRLPAMFDRREFVDAGGLMVYGPSIAAQWYRAAYYVDRILKGTKPADLPVEQPMTFDFVVNMKTARELGITFPHEILLQVTEAIDQ